MRKFKVHRDGPGGLEPFTSDAGSEGFNTATLVSLEDGSTHVEISLCSLNPGGFVGGHLHPFEESFYVLSGEAIVSIDHTAHHVVTDDFGFAPVSAPHAWSNPFDETVTWYRVRSPQPRPVGEFNGTYPVKDYPAPTSGRSVRELHPRSRHLGQFDLANMSPPGPLMMPGTHGHNIHNVSVRMMVDDVLGAIHHQTFMVKFEPADGEGFSGSPHYHDFEEAYYVVAGQGETELEGERFDMEPGDLVWVASGTMHAWRARGQEPLRFIELMAPRPPYMNLLFSEATWRQPAD
jgi:quercetin dioxygenase-like cupin family protein